jgi:hypothetical protein
MEIAGHRVIRRQPSILSKSIRTPKKVWASATRQFHDERLRELCSDAATSLEPYQRATEAAIRVGFVVPQGRESVRQDSKPGLIPE